MICKRCGSKIGSADVTCPGCLTSVDNLMMNGLIERDDSPVSQTINDSYKENIIVNNANEFSSNVSDYSNINSVESLFEDNLNNAEEAIPPITNNEGVSNIDSVSFGDNNLTNKDELEVSNKGNMNNDYGKPKKKKHFGLVIFLVLLILIVGGLGYYYFFIYCSPKNVFHISSSKVYSSIFRDSNKYTNETGSLSLSMNVSGSDEYKDIFEIINKLDISVDYKFDYENDNLYCDISTKYDNEKLLDLYFFTQDKVGYLSFKDLYDQYIRILPEETGDIKTIDYYNNVKIVFDNILATLKAEIKDSNYKSSKETVMIDSKKINATKNTLVLNSDDISNLYNKIKEKLLNDTNSLEALKVMTGETKEEIEKDFNDFKIADNENIEISIYTEGLLNKLIKFEVIEKYADGTTTFVLAKASDTKYQYNLNDSISGNYEGEITIDGNKTNIVINSKDFSVSLDMTVLKKYDQEIKKENIPNYVDYDKMTDEDYQKIGEKLASNKGFENLYTKIFEIFMGENTLNTEYDDYDVNYGEL